MMKIVDNFLNKITMYRLVVYELSALLVLAGIFGIFGFLPYKPIFLVFSVVFIFCVSWTINKLFAYMFEVPSNPESTWITALILALIVSPAKGWLDMQFLPLAFWASAWAVASKYILAIKGKNVFNPAALGVAIVSITLGLSASWWIGTAVMAPFVILGGFLIVRKIHRFDLCLSFIGVFAAGIVYSNFSHGLGVISALWQSFLLVPVFFFATVMLTEPATTPPTRTLRILYGAFVAFLFLPNVNIAGFYFTPELALLAGNILAYLVSPKYKLMLELKKVTQLSPNVLDFAFAPNRPISYKPGQYMEWTLAHKNPDSRSFRRYFTLSSSPTESEVRMGVKFYEPASTFKKALLLLPVGQSLMAGQLAGDFTMPRNKNKKLAFIAGGIGVTPYRSMVQYLLDKKEKRDIAILYSNKAPEDAVYADVFERARQELGVRTIYAFSAKNIVLPAGAVSSIDADVIMQKVPDYEERIFYISGPQSMVTVFRETLLSMGIKRSHIKTDYFPGFA